MTTRSFILTFRIAGKRDLDYGTRATRLRSHRYCIESVEHRFSQCCDSCSCLSRHLLSTSAWWGFFVLFWFFLSLVLFFHAFVGGQLEVLSNQADVVSRKGRRTSLQIYFGSVKGLKSKCLLAFYDAIVSQERLLGLVASHVSFCPEGSLLMRVLVHL